MFQEIFGIPWIVYQYFKDQCLTPESALCIANALTCGNGIANAAERWVAAERGALCIANALTHGSGITNAAERGR